MKIALSAFGLQFAAGYDADAARNDAIDRAARRVIRAEERAAEIDARAEIMRAEQKARADAIAARVEELRIKRAAEAAGAEVSPVATAAE